MTNFTFIIPHKNTPELLLKCIDSIPRREDAQVIVVDDNSDNTDFDKLRADIDALGHSNLELVLTKEGRGAGYARNVGLSKAEGKWIVFADADDFFNECIEEAMEKYVDSEAEVVFLRGNSIKVPSGEPAHRGEGYDALVDEALTTGDKFLPVFFSSPWRKFFRKSFLDKYGINFNEVRWGNDVVFMAKVARYASQFEISPLRIYCITDSSNSLVKASSLESQVCRLEQECQEVSLVKQRYPNREAIYFWLFRCWFNVYKISKTTALRYLPKTLRSGGLKVLKVFFQQKFS